MDRGWQFLDDGSPDHLPRASWDVAPTSMRGVAGEGMDKPMSHGWAEGMPKSVVEGWGRVARPLVVVGVGLGGRGGSSMAGMSGSPADYATAPWVWGGRGEPTGVLTLERGGGRRRPVPGRGWAEPVSGMGRRLAVGDRVVAPRACHG